ncbi:MAG: universal stress protein [Amphritea sp.]
MSKNILIPIDPQNPELINKALKLAISQAREKQAVLHVLTVLPGFNNPIVASYFPKDAMEQALSTTGEKLSSYLEDNVPTDVQTQLHVQTGNPYKQVLNLAEKLDVGMIVIPSRKRGRADQVLLGSVTAKVVEQASCSVLVVRS